MTLITDMDLRGNLVSDLLDSATSAGQTPWVERGGAAVRGLTDHRGYSV